MCVSMMNIWKIFENVREDDSETTETSLSIAFPQTWTVLHPWFRFWRKKGKFRSSGRISIGSLGQKYPISLQKRNQGCRTVQFCEKVILREVSVASESSSGTFSKIFEIFIIERHIPEFLRNHEISKLYWINLEAVFYFESRFTLFLKTINFRCKKYAYHRKGITVAIRAISRRLSSNLGYTGFPVPYCGLFCPS